MPAATARLGHVMTGARGYLGFAAKARENPWLDAVRAFAVVLVLLRHGQIALVHATGATPAGVGVLFVNGWVGVDLFFVLSGYLISRHLLQRGLESGAFSPAHYFAGRALRIVPAYVAALTMTAAGLFPLYVIEPVHLDVRIVYHLLFLQDYLPANINVVFWSLGVEEKFYLIAPLVLLAVARQRSLSRAVVLLGVLGAVSVIVRGFTYGSLAEPIAYKQFFPLLRSPFHACLEPLAVGILIAVLERRNWLVASTRGGCWLGLCALAVALAGLASHDFMAAIHWYDVLVQPVAIALAAGALVAGAVRLAATPFTLAWLVRPVAHLSYCLYLMHFPLTPLALHLSGGVAGAFWAIYLAASFGAALALHYLIEKPFLLLKERRERAARGTMSKGVVGSRNGAAAVAPGDLVAGSAQLAR